MLKEERLSTVLELVNKNGVIDVNELIRMMNVSDMTIRRDLAELEKRGQINRIHGGAQSINLYKKEELSHEKKQIIHPEEKKAVVQKALKLISEDDTIFLGPGTTIEMLAQSLSFNHLRVITNSLPVFTILKAKATNYQIYLVGGEYRELTGAFFGEITNKMLMNFRFGKAFVGANAVKDNRVMTATIEEGTTQNIALNNSTERYLLVDSSKLNVEDFYTFFQLDKMTALITNDEESYENTSTAEEDNVY